MNHTVPRYFTRNFRDYRNIRGSLAILIFLFLLCSISLQASPKREMRAAWIATVANIDWPSKSAVGNEAAQKREMLAILDSAKALNLNMVIFQARPNADALYRSELEPWSAWLTGEQGKPVSYDPLAFVVEEAHKRCLDVHVWLNPYRLGTSNTALAPNHIYRQHPEWFVKYGKQWYFNPGLEETRTWLCRVAADIVSRYDVDGLHFDDYFYPYRVPGEEFPDNNTFRTHSRGFTDKEAWRRNNVDLVIQQLHDTIKALKPWVEFGISPFGVWRNEATDPVRGSATKAGVQNYDDLYADILLWLEKGWIDYVVPQLYWEIGKQVADYRILTYWWDRYRYGQNLYIGQSLSGLGHSKVAAWNQPNEICRQLRLNRQVEGVSGQVFFPIHNLFENRLGLCDSLRADFYRYPALPPSVERNAHLVMPPANLELLPVEGSYIQTRLQWQAVADARYYVVYAFPAGNGNFADPQHILTITLDTHCILTLDPEEFTICVTTIDRYHFESLPTILE